MLQFLVTLSFFACFCFVDFCTILANKDEYLHVTDLLCSLHSLLGFYFFFSYLSLCYFVCVYISCYRLAYLANKHGRGPAIISGVDTGKLA